MSVRTLIKRTNAETDNKELTRLFNVLGEMVRWQNNRALVSTLNIIIGLVKSFDWTFSDELERSTLARLRRIARSTSVNAEVSDIPERLEVRQQAARLAYQLSKYYTKQGNSIPEVIREWETICQSEDEFAEIKNQWHDLEEKVHDN